MSIDDLTEKLALIDKDLERLRKEAGNDRQLSALVEYRDYILDEIKTLKNDNGS